MFFILSKNFVRGFEGVFAEIFAQKIADFSEFFGNFLGVFRSDERENFGGDFGEFFCGDGVFDENLSVQIRILSEHSTENLKFDAVRRREKFGDVGGGDIEMLDRDTGDEVGKVRDALHDLHRAVVNFGGGFDNFEVAENFAEFFQVFGGDSGRSEDDFATWNWAGGTEHRVHSADFGAGGDHRGDRLFFDAREIRPDLIFL